MKEILVEIAKLVNKPELTDPRPIIQEDELRISKQIVEMVFKMNPILDRCWVSFFAGHINWFTEEPYYYYVQHSYYYEKN